MALDKAAERRPVTSLRSLDKLTIFLCLTTSSLTVGRLVGGAIHAAPSSDLRDVREVEAVRRLGVESVGKNRALLALRGLNRRLWPRRLVRRLNSGRHGLSLLQMEAADGRFSHPSRPEAWRSRSLYVYGSTAAHPRHPPGAEGAPRASRVAQRPSPSGRSSA